VIPVRVNIEADTDANSTSREAAEAARVVETEEMVASSDVVKVTVDEVTVVARVVIV